MARRCGCGDFDCVQSGRKPLHAPAFDGVGCEMIERLGETPDRRNPRRRDVRGWKHGGSRRVSQQWARHKRGVGQTVTRRTDQTFPEGEDE